MAAPTPTRTLSDGAPGHRTRQGHLPVSQLSRQHRSGDRRHGDWRRVPNEFARGHVHVFGPYLYRSEFWATTPEESQPARCTTRARHPGRGPQSVAAILPETIRARLACSCCRRAISRACARSLTATASSSSSTRSRPASPAPVSGSRSRCLRRAAGPDHLRQGVNSGYVPVGGVIISGADLGGLDKRVFPGA